MLRFLLFPISVVYGAVTIVRNALYDSRVFKSSSFDLPVICIGNLSMGGTGKTPHTEYLIRLLSEKYKVATLSRGYGRKTSTFVLAGEDDTALTIGDEPLQYFRKFKNIKVAVEKRRVMGVLFTLHHAEDTEVIILDDAFQHRALNAGLNILLTDYNQPFFRDYILPVGDLREQRKGADRADLVVVTKCPDTISTDEIQEFQRNISVSNENIFFSSVNYKGIYEGKSGELLASKLGDFKVLLVTGIANPKPIEEYLQNRGVEFEAIHYGDHYKFKKKDVENISKKFDTFTASKKLILTTEKDFSRMLLISDFEKLPIYCLEIEITILNDKENFDKKILEYVRANQRDRELPEGEDEL
ncbi:tetraacyldisaccharide 4'-kinase [Parvicella tangerina]|nr:tetraacyldisaccharide 4'-kinase [Parvicella tangerina]